MSTLSRYGALLSFFAIGISTAAVGEVATKDSTAKLRKAGFKDTSYLLNTEGTVSDVLSGDYNLEVNDTETGGAVVTLGGQANTYTGGTYVRCGTLVVPSAASLGSSTLPIVLGSGTIHFTDDMTINRNFTGLPAEADTGSTTAAYWTMAPVFSVAEGKTVHITGKVNSTSTLTSYFNTYKRGPGTLIVETQSGNNSFSYSSGVVEYSRWVWAKVPANANGDSQRSNRWSGGIFDGTVVINTAPTVTSRYLTCCIGGFTTSEANSETAAHFEARSGKVTFANVHLGHFNGNVLTAPDGVESTFTVSGGDVEVSGNFSIARTIGESPLDPSIDGIWTETNATSRAKLTVSAGKLDIKGNLYFGTPYGLNERGRVTVSGGELCVSNIVCGGQPSEIDKVKGWHDDGYAGQNVDYIISNSTFTVNDTIWLRAPGATAGGFKRSDKYSNSQHHFYLQDKGVFAMRTFKEPTNHYNPNPRIFAIGGTFKWLKSSEILVGGSNLRLVVYKQGMTFDISDFDEGAVTPQCQFRMVKYDDSNNGTIRVTGAGRAFCWGVRSDSNSATLRGLCTDEARILLGGKDNAATLTVPTSFAITNNGAIGACGWHNDEKHTVTVNKLEFGPTGTLEVGHATGANNEPSLLVANAFVPPTEELRVTTYADTGTAFERADVPLGTFDILKYPSSVTLDVTKCRYAGKHTHLTHKFTTVTSGSWTTLKMTVEKKGMVVIFR